MVANDILINLEMYVFSIEYLEDRSFYFVKFLKGVIKESKKLLVGLDKQVLPTDNEQLTIFDDLDTNRIRRKNAICKR